MTTTLAPVAIFAYRRPAHLRATLETLMDCEGFGDSPIVIHCDGPADEQQRDAVEATKAVARQMLGEKAEYRFSETNLGLSKSIIVGVSNVVERYGRVIVVEDDLAVAPGFLAYMNKALDRYAGADTVYQVSGYQYQVSEFKNRQSALFLPLTVSWGWGTWKRAWDQLDPLATGWEALKDDKATRRRFNFGGAYDYARMLERQMNGQSDSWAIRWYWTVFRNHGKVLFPPHSLVRNNGFDGSGTHGRGFLRNFNPHQLQPAANQIQFPENVNTNDEDYQSVRRAMIRANGGPLARAVDRLGRLLGSGRT